jgi:Family of unknown function (DUF6335)
MAKRRPRRRGKSTRRARKGSRGSTAKPAASARSGRRPSRKITKTAKGVSKRQASGPNRAAKRGGSAQKRASQPRASSKTIARRSPPHLDRVRRTLEEEIVPAPPSSLNLDRRGSAARTGREELAQNLKEHKGMTAVTAGDLDADPEQAYFSGDEAPGGDNPTPDQEVVEDIGKALGVEYQDNEELRSGDKVSERDKHRWELDPASSEDYKDRT